MHSFSQHYSFKSGWNVRFILKRVHGCRFLHFISLFSMRASSILTHTHIYETKYKTQAIIHVQCVSHFTHYPYSDDIVDIETHYITCNGKTQRQNDKTYKICVIFIFMLSIYCCFRSIYTLQVSIFPFVTYSFPWIRHSSRWVYLAFSLSCSVCTFVSALVIIVVMFLLRQNVLLNV